MNADEKSGVVKVDWDNKDDRLNPMNWKGSKKWLNVLIISVMAFVTPLASSMFAPGVPLVEKEFHFTNSHLATLTVSIFLLGFAVGPLVIAPLSEIHGRRPVYVVSMFIFFVCTLACALSINLGMLLAFRVLSGCAGSTAVTIGGATIGDMFQNENRGGAMAIWGMGAQLGPFLGPIIGGFLSETKGWRWVFWLQTIVSGVVLLLGAGFLRETYPVVILQRKTQRRIQETGNANLISALQDPIPRAEVFRRAIVRPPKIFFFSPIVSLLSIYIAVLFAYLYIFVTTFPVIFQQQYHFSIGTSGLTYLGLAFGCLTGLIIAGKTSDMLYRRLTARNHGVSKPEYRLPPLMLSSPLVATAFFWYGWSAHAKTHWIVPIIGTSFFGMGMMPAFMATNLYLVDAYTKYAASALAAARVLQSIAGATLPLAGPALYNRLGFGWGNSVLAFMALAFFPVPLFFYRYGERLRNMFTVVI